jgi:DNA (cytosine-5)-methyltransferase 1
MRYFSVCSGIESASVAWSALAWTPVAFAEIESFACAVLAHHYPDVPNLGDIKDFKEWPLTAFDVLVGGTPCQSFSVAGLRTGLADPRGNLALVYLAIVERYRPRWLVWENVPGVMSTDGGRDFGAFLGGLVELGYGWAYRILDAHVVPSGLKVRRLMPVECEKLLGLPEDYTLVPYRGAPARDGPRYRAIGNSMAVNCMRWIGRRIGMVEASQ